MSCAEQVSPCRWSAWLSDHGGCGTQEPLTSLNHVDSIRLDISHTLTSQDRLAWDKLTKKTPWLQSAYLSALSVDDTTERHFWVRFFQGEQLIGVSFFTRADFMGPSVQEHLGHEGFLASLLGWVKTGHDPMTGQVLICGHSSLIGHRAYQFERSINISHQQENLTRAAHQIVKQLSSRHLVDAILFSGDQHLNEPSMRGYTLCPTEPRMKMTLSPSWLTFEDYLQDLTSKYRVKMKRAYSKSKALTSRRLNPNEVERYHDVLSEFYSQVSTRAKLSFKTIEISALSALMRATPEAIALYAYFLEDELIGFRVSLHSHDQLIAHLVGINYTYNQEHSIYPRILNDYLKEAIELRVKALDFGRTAGEIKSTLGARPQPSSVLLKHQHPILQCALPAISKRLNQRSNITPFKVHHPFRAS